MTVMQSKSTEKNTQPVTDVFIYFFFDNFHLLQEILCLFSIT